MEDSCISQIVLPFKKKTWKRLFMLESIDACTYKHQRLFAIAITYACCIISALHRWLMLPEELCSISPIGRLEMFRSLHNTECVFSVQCVCVCVCVPYSQQWPCRGCYSNSVHRILVQHSMSHPTAKCGLHSPVLHPPKSPILARYGPCTHPLGPYLQWTCYRDHNARNIPTHQSSSPSTIRSTSSLMPQASRMTSI